MGESLTEVVYHVDNLPVARLWSAHLLIKLQARAMSLGKTGILGLDARGVWSRANLSTRARIRDRSTKWSSASSYR